MYSFLDSTVPNQDTSPALVSMCMCVSSGPDEGPLNLVVTPRDAFMVSATWSPPRFRNRNGAILRYVVNITRTTTSGVGAQLHNTPDTNLVTGSLHPYYSYYYSVAAENSIGRGPFTTVTIQMPEARKLDSKKGLHLPVVTCIRTISHTASWGDTISNMRD